jgi:hypothetical protein
VDGTGGLRVADYGPTGGDADGRRPMRLRTFDLEPNRRAWCLLANGLVLGIAELGRA